MTLATPHPQKQPALTAAAPPPQPCRYLTGRGVPLLPDEGLRHAKAATPALMPELEESGAAQG